MRSAYELVRKCTERIPLRLNLRLAHKAVLLVAVPLTFEIVIVLMLSQLLQTAQSAALEENYSKDVIARAESMMKKLSDLELTFPLYLTTKNVTFGLRIQDALEALPTEISGLSDLVRGHVSESRQMERVEPLARDDLDLLQEAKTTVDFGGRSLAFDDNQELKEQISEYSRQLANEVHALVEAAKRGGAEKLEEKTKASNWLQIVLKSAVGFNVFLVVFLALFLNKGTVRRLQLLVDNSMRLAHNQPLNPPMKGQDEIAYLDKVFHDMAASVAEANRKERAVVDNAVDVICSLDVEGKFAKVNPAAARVWGYAPDELVGRSIDEVIIAEDAKASHEAIKEIKLGRSTTTTFENRVKRKNGELSDNLWSVQWSESEQALFCVVHDISDRKEVERLKQEFLAMVSHDLRSPLTSIQCILSLLSAGSFGELPAEAEAGVNEAEGEATRLIRLVNDLLDMERMEAGKIDIHSRIIPLSTVLERSATAVHALAEKAEVSIEREETFLSAYADDDRLVQVLVNLLSNAIKFSPAGSTIRMVVEDLSDDVAVQVIDQGRGVPAHLCQSIFEKFKQVEADDARQKGGTGLGLPICKNIIEAHGGTIGVYSEEGKGSTFWFRLQKKKKAPDESIESVTIGDKAQSGR